VKGVAAWQLTLPGESGVANAARMLFKETFLLRACIDCSGGHAERA
jgi:hypothetical protein